MTTTVRWLWVCLLIAALLMRLAALNAVPLSPDETLVALPALDAARGAGWPESDASPLLLVGNALLFFLFGPGDGIARLLPALAGTALVAVPWLWRRRLGEVGALAAAALLACSPVALFASRRLDGSIVGVLGVALVLSTWLYPDQEGRPVPGLAAIGLALGLTGGAAGYDLFLAGLVAWLAYRWISAREVPRPTRAAASATGWILVGGLCGALIISTGLGWRWNGWASLGDGFAAWFAEWQQSSPTYPVPFLLALYEPLTLLLALIALVRGMSGRETKEGTPHTLALGLWALLTTLLPTLRPGAAGTAAVAAVLPLALLAGQEVRRLVESTRRWSWLPEGLQGTLTFVVWGYLGIQMAYHAARGTGSLPEIMMAVLTLMLQLLLFMGFTALFEVRSAARGLLLGTAAVLWLIQGAFGWGLAFLRAGDPAEPLVSRATATDLRALRQVVDDLGRVQGRPGEEVDVALVAGDAVTTAVTRWALRDLSRLQVTVGWPTTAPTLIVSPTDVTPLADSATRRGMAFTAIVQTPGTLPACTSLRPLVCRAPLAWYLYRRLPVSPQREQIVLWGPPSP